MNALVDPGSSSSLVFQKCVLNQPTYKSGKTGWETTAGKFATDCKVSLNFQMNELSQTALVNHQFDVSKENLGRHDMIIGRDLTNQTGLDTCGSDLTIKWPQMNAEVPCKPSRVKKAESFFIQEPKSSKGKTDRLSRILDAKHGQADLNEAARDVETLNLKEQSQLENVSRVSETPFDGTLGRWQGEPYKIKLKDNMEPFHAKPFPVPFACEQTLRTEVKRLKKQEC